MSDAHFITCSFIRLILQTPIKYLLCAGHGARVRAPEMTVPALMVLPAELGGDLARNKHDLESREAEGQWLGDRLWSQSRSRFKSWLRLGEILEYSSPQFPHLYVGSHNRSYFTGLL